ncbi:C40 family peptidase [Demequina sp. SYSU T00068]|uniref:C40 family peptidase n=1 Tax=Demequina lignilytica TaxID=3051663 RepID=UPI002626C581|nr:C40 family peptidase [Demequina sp. SYSU T00068]MDN4490632.1 C40 family peptidase [Demequina sp. SYSU T00068]
MTGAGKRVLALLAMFGVAAGVVIAGPPQHAVAEDYPGQAEIDAARAAANDLAAGIDELDNAIAALADARDKATANALLAAENYSQAADASDQAQTTLEAANQRAADAEVALAEARAQLASIAQAAYRGSGGLAELGAVVGAETVDQAVVRSEAMTRSSEESDILVQRVKAAELVASTMRTYAEEAAVEAVAAAEEAEAALAEAQDAQAHAEEAVALAEEARVDAVARLAELRGVTIELEQQRQAGLEADRQRAAQEAAERAQAEAEAEYEASRPSTTSTPAATTSTPRPTTSSPAATTAAPQPTTTTPAPAQTTTAPEPEETATTPAPKPTTNVPGTSTAQSTAAQGQVAADYAVTLVGKAYGLGMSGPDQYDCSGVTSSAWSAAGQWITRSSRSQYAATKHLPYSQLRPGDLVFYATNTSDPSTIFHVAIYIGDGQVMEAVNYSKPAGIRSLYSWMTSNMMPYIGRP